MHAMRYTCEAHGGPDRLLQLGDLDGFRHQIYTDSALCQQLFNAVSLLNLIARSAVLRLVVGRRYFVIILCSEQVMTLQGWLLESNFNQAEALHAFELAAEADPSAAMPHWGVAYALGPGANRWSWPSCCHLAISFLKSFIDDMHCTP